MTTFVALRTDPAECLACRAGAAAACGRRGLCVALGDSYPTVLAPAGCSLRAPPRRSVSPTPTCCSPARASRGHQLRRLLGATTSDLLNSQISAVTATNSSRHDDRRQAALVTEPRIPIPPWRTAPAALDSTRTSLESMLGSRLDSVYTTIQGHAALGARWSSSATARVFLLQLFPGRLRSGAATGTNQLADALDAVIATHVAKAGGITSSAISPSSTTPSAPRRPG